MAVMTREADLQPAGTPLAARDWARATNRKRLARVGKIALPIFVLGLVVLLYFWSRVNLDVIRIQIGDSELAPQEIDSISMANARFAGTDSENRSFVVTARMATQEPGQEDVLQLQQPKADIVLAGGARVTIDADSGTFRRDAKLLDLAGKVTLVHDEGFEVRTTRARIDLDGNSASGDAPVVGHGPDGDIAAEGFRVTDDGANILFSGRSRMTVRTDEEETGE